MKILLVKTSSMGDVLHTLPALTDALIHYPDIVIDWVVEENFAQIPSWHKAVRHVIPVALRRWRKNWFAADIRKERIHFLRTLQSEKYDLIIDAQGLIKSAMLVVRHAKGIKHGYDFKSAREGIASLFYHVKHQVDWDQHAVMRIRMLFAKTLQYTPPIDKGDYDIAEHFLGKPKQITHFNAQSASLPAEPEYLVFLHSTTRDEKHWPEDNWIALIKKLSKDNLTIKLPWGTEAERARAIRLAEHFNFVTVLPKLTLAQIAEELANAKAVVSVDTGLSHLTAALSRPNITLFGPTDPKLIGGYGQNQYSLISPTGHLADLKAEIVYAKLSSLLMINEFVS